VAQSVAGVVVLMNIQWTAAVVMVVHVMRVIREEVSALSDVIHERANTNTRTRIAK